MEVALSAGYQQMLVIPHTGNMESVAWELGIPCRVIHYYGWVRPVKGNFFDQHFLKRLLRNMWSVVQLVFLIVRYKPTLIFSNTSVMNIGAWAALLTHTKHYWYIHEMGEEDFGFKLPWGKMSYRFMALTSKLVLTNSLHLAKKYIAKYKGIKIKVIRNPVFVKDDYKTISWEKELPVRLLLLGQVTATKGHSTAIDALSLFNQSGNKVNLSIVGKV